MAKNPKGTASLQVGGDVYDILLNHDALFDIDQFLEREGHVRPFLQGFMESPASAYRLTVAFHFGTKPKTKSVQDARKVLKDVSEVDLVNAITQALVNGGLLKTETEAEGDGEGEA